MLSKEIQNQFTGEFYMDASFPFEFSQPNLVGKHRQVPLEEIWDYAPFSELLLVGNGTECIPIIIIYLS